MRHFWKRSVGPISMSFDTQTPPDRAPRPAGRRARSGVPLPDEKGRTASLRAASSRQAGRDGSGHRKGAPIRWRIWRLLDWIRERTFSKCRGQCGWRGDCAETRETFEPGGFLTVRSCVCRGEGDLRGLAALGAAAGVAWARCTVDSCPICEAIREDQQGRRWRCGSDLRGGAASDDAVCAAENGGATGSADGASHSAAVCEAADAIDQLASSALRGVRRRRAARTGWVSELLELMTSE